MHGWWGGVAETAWVVSPTVSLPMGKGLPLFLLVSVAVTIFMSVNVILGHQSPSIVNPGDVITSLDQSFHAHVHTL